MKLNILSKNEAQKLLVLAPAGIFQKLKMCSVTLPDDRATQVQAIPRTQINTASWVLKWCVIKEHYGARARGRRKEKCAWFSLGHTTLLTLILSAGAGG
jgi:hypothetical protein